MLKHEAWWIKTKCRIIRQSLGYLIEATSRKVLTLTLVLNSEYFNELTYTLNLAFSCIKSRSR